VKPTALVTGANRGIGLAIAQGLAELGHAVWLGSRELDAGEGAAGELRAAGLDVTALELDLTTPDSIETAVDRIEASGQRVTVLVNNAGVLHQLPLLETSDAEIAEAIAVHLTGPIRLVRRVAPHMTSAGFGRIVNVSSDWGSFHEGLGGPGAYGITKAALNALTVRLAKELPATIKVNALCPGWVATRMGGPGATRTPKEGADTALWLATLSDDGPTGGLFKNREPLGW
jgi:NAD(P)-dependent dehydrogenase (short-subunit alcohol dehydrogenase family)